MKIFNEFSIKEYCVLARVCKKWNHIAQSKIEHSHQRLESLNLFGTIGDNLLFSSIMRNMRSLRVLNLDYCTGVNDQAFTLSKISCPLEELHLSNLNIGDASLESLRQVSGSLRKLVVKNCIRLTNISIAVCLEKLVNLCYFDVRNTSADNVLLKTALSFSKRKIYLVCQNSQIDVFAFLKDFQNTEKEFVNSSDMLFRHRNLSFEYSIECI
jgi:hypothetical protein